VLAAVHWAEAVLIGPLATGLAVVAIAGLGYHLLTGQIALRRAGQVLLGLFILFGAPTFARELAATLRGSGQAMPDQAGAAAPPPAPTLKQEPRDPYAGASLPE
jgi:type IV secretory pathway VirB2 component (pilin)